MIKIIHSISKSLLTFPHASGGIFETYALFVGETCLTDPAQYFMEGEHQGQKAYFNSPGTQQKACLFVDEYMDKVMTILS